LVTKGRLDRQNGRPQVQSSSSTKENRTERAAGLLANLLDPVTDHPV
jgi:hypothetical protein